MTKKLAKIYLNPPLGLFMNYIFVRVNQKNKNSINEKLSLISYASSKNIKIDSVFYDDALEKEELNERKHFLGFLKNLQENDKIIISSMDALGWRVGELVQIIAKIFDKKAEVVCATDEERLHPCMQASILISKLAQARAKNIKIGRSKLGRPEGSRSKSKYDSHLPKIIDFLKTSRNISALARELNVSRTSLKDYVASRGL
jgi:DNA invertase Pin-like site-specific DNA recombinase